MKNKLHLRKKRRLSFNNSEDLLFIKINLPTRIYPTRNLQLPFILTHWSCSKFKNILETLNVYKIPSKEHQVVDRWDADEISVW